MTEVTVHKVLYFRALKAWDNPIVFHTKNQAHFTAVNILLSQSHSASGTTILTELTEKKVPTIKFSTLCQPLLAIEIREMQ